MKKLFALLMALTMTFQLVTPAWADTAEEHTHENTSTVEETTEPPTEETAAPTEEAPTEETAVATEETTVPAEAEPSEEPEEAPVEDSSVDTYATLPTIHLPSGICVGCGWTFEQCYTVTQGQSNWRSSAHSDYPGKHSWWCAMNARETAWEYHDTAGANGACSVCGHVHAIEAVPAKEPTATEEGNNAYYICTSCKGVYLDAAASINTTVADETLPKLSDNTCGDNLTWAVDENGTLTISGTGAMADYAYKTRAPWYGYRTRITAVVVESGVTSIGSFAFYDCSRITAATLPAELTAVGNYAFDSCTGLTDVNYGGRIADWKNISIALHNAPLLNVAIHYMPGHAHELTKVNAVVSCTEVGVAEHYVCDICGALFADAEDTEPATEASLVTPAAGHDLTLTEAVAAGHTTPGSNAYYTCARCGKLFKDAEGKQETTLEAEVVPAEGHTMVKTEAVAPTYFAPGNNEYYTCSVCGKVYKDEAGQTETTVEDEVLAGLPSIALGDCGENLTWVLAEDGTLTISGEGKMANYSTSSVAPWYNKRTKILSVVIEPGVTSIGAYAFYACLKLTDVELPEGITYIGESAFQDCAKLKTVEIPEGVEYIRSSTFQGCTGLTGVNIPNGVTSIGYYAFYDCSSLVSIRIPKGVTEIEYGSFHGCSSLTNVSIPDSVTNIGTNAFQNCSSLTSVNIPDSVTSIGYSAFAGCKSLKSMSIPEGVTSIESSAFYGCSSLASVSVPESITSIGDSAFSGCTSLTNVNIPEGVMSIGSYAFDNCNSLTSISIPEGVTSIEYRTFYNCTNLENITLPEGLLSIANSYNGGVFENCISLKSIVIPDSVTSVGDSAFGNCGSLKSVHMSNSVTSIGAYAFENCTSLTSIEIPESVTSLGYKAFYGCTALTSADILGKITEIQRETFHNCTNLERVTLPDGLLEIGGPTPGGNGYGAFENCSSLKEIVIPDSVTSIAPRAFENCSSLVSIRIPDGVTVIEYSTFSNCTSLESVTLPAKLQKMGRSHYIGTFEGCTALKSVTIPDGTEIIDYDVFRGCSSLASVSIPQSVTKVGDSAFDGCSNLKDVYYSGDEVAWKQIEIGYSNESLTTAYLHYGLTHICTTHLVSAVAPTCVAAGNNAYYLCDACGRVYKDELGRELTTVEDETLAALGHSMTETAAKAATCIDDGNNVYYTCGNCHKVFKDEAGETETTVSAEILPALGHAIIRVDTVAPTCTEKGNRAYYLCTTCQRAFKDKAGTEATTVAAETIPALGHSMTKTEAVAPTCTQKGNNVYYTCATCRKVYQDQAGKRETTVEAETLNALGHTMEVITATEPTCTEVGYPDYVLCTVCHKIFLDRDGKQETTLAEIAIPALGHSMVKTEAVAPTCTERGSNAYYTCATCRKVYKDEQGNTETTAEAEVLPALGHDMEKTEAVAPTHTAGGNNAYYTCRTCGKVFKDAQGTLETTPEQEQLPRLPGIADGKCGGLTWLLSDEGVLTVSGKGRMPDYSGSALAPWYDYRDQITALEVEEGVTSIGSYAFFDCTNLTSVSLPKSLTKLGRDCFSGCDSLNLLDISGLPKELTQKVTDLSGIAKLPEMLSRRVGSSAVYTWALEDAKSAPAKLAGSELTVLRSGSLRLVCTEEYTGLTASAEVSAQTATVIRPEEREQLTGGDSLTLSVWAMPFETELKAKWSLDEASEAYASITENGVLTAKAVTEPVQITVRAVPTAGEDSAEKTLWILPKTTAMGILADGHLVGDSLTIELTEKTGLTLTAQIQPQGAKAEVLWTSSRTDVAEIGEDGTVRFLKPGTTVIRAESRDGSGIAAELTLKGQYLDGAETLTLTSDAEEAGLEVGRTAKLTLSGENAIDSANVEFYVAQGTAATVDDQGLVTAGDVPGTVTIVAALKNDPLLRRAELTLQVIPALVRSLRLNAEVSQEWGYFEELDGEYSLYAEISEVTGKNRSFRLTALGSDYRDNWSEVTNLAFETSDPAVAQVSDNGTVTLTAAAAGVCTVTVRCTDSLRAEAQLRIVIQDRSPRLESNRLTLNSNLTAGVSTGLVDGGGNTVQSVTVHDYNKTAKAYETEPSQMFAAEAEDGTLTLRSLGAQKNGTYSVKLAVICLSGTYEFLVQVKVANSLPAVTVKQLSKFNLFYLDSTAQLSVTAKNAEVEKVELVGADSFRLDDSGELSYAETFAPGDKAVTRGTLRVTLAGYQVPVEKAFTVATVTTAPKLTTDPASSAINLALAEPECRVRVLTNGQALDLTGAEITAAATFAEMENTGSHLVFRLTENKGGTVNLTLRLPGWTQAVKLSHRITAENKLPTVKLGTTALKLNSVFTRQTASTTMSLSQGNMDLGTMTFAPTAKEGTAARTESEKITLSYDPETATLGAAITDPDNVPKNGTYSYTFTAALADGTELKGGTVRVSVASTTPRVKLSAASVKLNRYLAGREQAVVTATMTGGAGYRLVGFEGMPAYMSFDAGTGRLTVTLPDADLTADTCTLLPVIADETTGQEATLNTKLTFKVQTMYSDKLTLSLTAKGKLDTTRPESVLTYTVNKVNNCLGTVDNVFLEGEDANLFQAELDTDGAKPVVTLRTVPGQVYATNKAYKIQLRFSVCGAEVLSNVLTVKVSQTALKVTVPRTSTFYLSQTAALRCSLTSNVPMESVSLNAKTSREFLEALGGEENLRFDGTRLEFQIVNPGALKAGKTYTVQLDITPENCAVNVKPTAVKLTVKVMK